MHGIMLFKLKQNSYTAQRSLLENFVILYLDIFFNEYMGID